MAREGGDRFVARPFGNGSGAGGPISTGGTMPSSIPDPFPPQPPVPDPGPEPGPVPVPEPEPARLRSE